MQGETSRVRCRSQTKLIGESLHIAGCLSADGAPRGASWFQKSRCARRQAVDQVGRAQREHESMIGRFERLVTSR